MCCTCLNNFIFNLKMKFETSDVDTLTQVKPCRLTIEFLLTIATQQHTTKGIQISWKFINGCEIHKIGKSRVLKKMKPFSLKLYFEYKIFRFG